MDVPSSRLYEDLADSFRGELLVDPVALAAYACDASPFEQHPLAVACPRDRDDVATILRYASEHHLPVIPRGSGTGPDGGAIGPGIVLDLSRFLRQIGPIVNGTIRVEAGVVLEELNRHLRPQGWMFGPDPMTAATTTIGGMLAVNASGARTLAVGTTRDAVTAIELVFADGRCAIATDMPRTNHRTPASDDLPVDLSEPALRWLDDQRLTHHDALTHQIVHWPRVLVGSEGSLGVFTAATLRLQPLPQHRGAVLLAFRSLEAAIGAVSDFAAISVAACDLLDRRLICLAHEAHSPWVELFSPVAEAALLIEWFAESEADRSHQLNRVLEVASRSGSSVEVCRVVLDNEEVDALWTLPASLLAMLARLPGTTRPLPVLAKLRVPLEHLEAVIVQIQRVLQHHGLTAALHAHAATGTLHFLPLAPTPTSDTATFWTTVTREVTAVVQQFEGPRSNYAAIHRALKEIFDPHGVLHRPHHPGGAESAGMLSVSATTNARHLRQLADAATLQPLLLNWSEPAALVETVDRCNGCGQCRTTSPTTRMCPFFRDSHDELAAPRAKANALRQLATMPTEVDAWETPSGQRLLETCFNCKQCEAECPSGVNIPQMMIEAKAQRVATNGLSRAEWFLTRIPGWMPWLRYAAIAVRPVLRRAWFRWLVERFTSITRHRRFPTWRTKPFLQTAPRAWRTPPTTLHDRVVVYFVDHVANWHEPDIALAAGRILEHHGFQVYVPTEQVRAGMDLVSCGDLDRARMLAEKNIAVLGEYARAGCPILCTEPAAALCLKVEYPRLVDHPDATFVASVSEEIGRFLSRLHAAKKLRTDFRPRAVRAAYHQPCHLRALGSADSLRELCSLIPGVETPKIEAGCSGMAGTFGWAKETYEQSVALGQPVARAWESVSATVALSECSSCRQQLEHLTHRRAQHPLLLLAEAYGLIPPPSPSP